VDTNDVAFDLVDDLTADPIVAIHLLVPAGPLSLIGSRIVSGQRREQVACAALGPIAVGCQTC
jgi:hypothetical protein